MHAYESIHKVLSRGYSIFRLGKGSDYDKIVLNFLQHTEETEKVIDVIEVSFRYIDRLVRNKLDEFKSGSRSCGYKNPKISLDAAIDELNYQFREHGVGYQYESGQIIKVDSQIIHSEVVKPALSFLSDPIYKNANEEFLKAWEENPPLCVRPKRFFRKTLDISSKLWFNRCITLADMNSVTARWRVCLPTVQGLKT